MEQTSYIRRNLARVRSELAACAARAGYPVPTLVAVTKSASDEEVLALAACGVSDMAENRVQCFSARQALLASHGFSPRLHLIGSLQTNKVKYLMADFKKKNGYLRSLQLSKEFDLYRQDYCGCLYSRPDRE